MKTIGFLFLAGLGILMLAPAAFPAGAQVSLPNAVATPYCLAANPASGVGYFVPVAVYSSVSPISLTDGANTYISTITGNAISCFIKQ